MANSPWTASAVKQRSVAKLLPYAGNARTHSPEQVAQIAASILEFGFVAPVLVDEAGEIIAGHGRVEAAKSLGLATVPTITRAGLTDAQKIAYRLADNRIALNAGWDEALLAAEFAKLQEMGDLDLALTGFDFDETDRLLATLATRVASEANPAGNEAGKPDGDDEAAEDPADVVLEPSRQAVTRPGDLWLLGGHLLLCGNSSDLATVVRVMREDRAVGTSGTGTETSRGILDTTFNGQRQGWPQTTCLAADAERGFVVAGDFYLPTRQHGAAI